MSQNTSSYTRGFWGVGGFGSSPTAVPVYGGLEYEEEGGGGENGMMAKAVVIHGVPTKWKINGVADCAGRITGEVIGVRWLLDIIIAQYFTPLYHSESTS